jgi:hypothetical protein
MAYEIHNLRPILSNFRQSPSNQAPEASLSHGHTSLRAMDTQSARDFSSRTKRLKFFKTSVVPTQVTRNFV